VEPVLERAAFDEVLVDDRTFVDSAKSGLIVKAFDLFVDVVKRYFINKQILKQPSHLGRYFQKILKVLNIKNFSDLFDTINC